MLGGEKGSVAFHGDHRPASIYVDGQAISEPSESTQEGTALTFERTYNHVAEVSVFGESVQDGTPTPDSPVPIVSRASACVETSDANGSKTSTTDLTALLDGRELRSLPDGTRDELQVRDSGDGTGDVVLVENVLHAVLAVADMNNSESYPGWVNVDGLYEACPNINERVACINSAGFFYVGKESIGVNTITTNVSSLWSTQSKIGMTQSEFKEAYPDLVIDFCIKRNVTKETVLGTIPMPETFYDTTHVWEANGADISARVKVFG